jgi:hypothetical protein
MACSRLLMLEHSWLSICHLVRSGKITVMREITTLLRGISIIVMPTLALAGGDLQYATFQE